MKTLLAILIPCVLLTAACKQKETRTADESTPGHLTAYHVPPGTSLDVEYYYFPDHDLYYHMPTSQWIFKDGDKWTTASARPEGMNFNPYTANSMEIGYYNCPPWLKALTEEKPAEVKKAPVRVKKTTVRTVTYTEPVVRSLPEPLTPSYPPPVFTPEPVAAPMPKVEKPDPYFLPSQPTGTLPPGVKPKFIKKSTVPESETDLCECDDD